VSAPDGTPESAPEPSTALLARCRRPAADRTTRLALVADTHVHAGNETWLRRAVADVADRDVDAVLHAGDLSGDGRPEEFDRFDAAVADLSAPLYVVPGNHDPLKSFNDHPTHPFDAFGERYPPGSLLVEVGPGGTTVELVVVADREELRDAYHERVASKTNAALLAGIVATNLARLPLVDEA